MAVDPVTPQEWQDAVDAARTALILRAARVYGLMAGGPRVDVQRCEQILYQGQELGYQPRADTVERFVAALRVGAGDG